MLRRVLLALVVLGLGVRLEAAGDHQARTLVGSASYAVSATTTVHLGDDWRRATFLLNVTSAASLVGDTLDVYLQRTVDGSTWDDFVHFTQVLGNGGAKKYVATWNGYDAAERELGAPQDAAMSAGVVQGGTLGDAIRMKVVIAGSGTHTFVFSLTAEIAE